MVPVCKALNSGMAGLFGPQSGVTSSHVQSICDTLEIPHIETRWDYRMKRDDYSVNLYPHPRALGQVSLICYHGQRSGFLLVYYVL
jgi:ionotropic glutamate receptor